MSIPPHSKRAESPKSGHEPVAEHKWLAINDVVRFQPEAGTLALDGEREIELSTTSIVEVQLCADGPYVVDVPATLEGAALAGRLRYQQARQCLEQYFACRLLSQVAQ